MLVLTGYDNECLVSGVDHDINLSPRKDHTNPRTVVNNDKEGFEISTSSTHTGLQSDKLHFETKLSKIKVDIFRGDLTKLRFEAIVNAANGYLSHGSGVAKAIADAAGKDLTTECNHYVNVYGPLHVAECMHSTAGLLKNRVKFVIHAVGPKYKETKGPQECQKILENTFLNCFIYGNDKLRVKSISVPAISSGKKDRLLLVFGSN